MSVDPRIPLGVANPLAGSEAEMLLSASVPLKANTANEMFDTMKAWVPFLSNVLRT